MPLRLLAFDMDGTLVETERLKARSYALAAVDLEPDDPSLEARVEAGYRDLVGRSREQVASGLVKQFGLEDAARTVARDGEEPWESYVRIRLGHYRAMIEDDATVLEAARPDADALVRHARSFACSVALVTTSDRPTTTRVLEALGLESAFDLIVTADDVAETKPDPEGYLRALADLEVEPADALVVEDSPAGVRASVSAGIHVLAVPTDLTRAGLEDVTGPLVRIVEAEDLVDAVRDAMA